MLAKTALSYRGALSILGHHDRPLVDRLDRILGGVILATGAVDPSAAVFGWMDQKNEGFRIVRTLLDAATDRLKGTAGKSRHELIAAAHTTIVCSALFESLHELIGPAYRELGLADDEKLRIVQESLYQSRVPMPSAVMGFHETLEREIHPFLEHKVGRLYAFLEGLAAWPKIVQRVGYRRLASSNVVKAAMRIYRDDFTRLAAAVPEFFAWSMLGEHAATRALMSRVGTDYRAAFDETTKALRKLEALLSLARNAPEAPDRDPRYVLHAINRGILEQTLAPVETSHRMDAVAVPTIESGYVTPEVRVSVHRKDARPSHEDWWQEIPPKDDLNLFLAAHFGTPESVERPLLLLGHPGAGKSLLTKVLAARLPKDGYTVVRVPLRRVDADAPIYAQLEQALRETTSGRVTWPELSEAAKDTTRVVLLDGFDELLQASSVGRAGYLQQVLEFQRTEASVGAPVAVVVTSRTLVIDRANIPDGCVLVKLEDFTDAQVEQWLEVWRQANLEAIEGGDVRALAANVAVRYPISRQPLLLLMLALYAADPSAPDLEAESLSVTALYRQLLDTFLRREVGKVPGLDSAGDRFEQAVTGQLWHLGVAAFAMFNRGQQSITDDQLNADLLALPDPPESGVHKPAHQTVGHFFFVYAAESDAHRQASVRRSYEFLHATFGEYLVAYYTINTLAELARRMPAEGRHIDDELPHALLCHQTLTTREAILPFAHEIVTTFPEADQASLLTLLNRLIVQARNRKATNEFVGYPPMNSDPVRKLAAYTGNLVLLRVYLSKDHEGVDRSALAPAGADPVAHWQSTVWLWKAGLDSESYSSLILSLVLEGDRVLAGSHKEREEHVALAYLSDDLDIARNLRVGNAVVNGVGDFMEPIDDGLLSYLCYCQVSGAFPEPMAFSSHIPANMSPLTAALVLRLGTRLILSADDLSRALVERAIRSSPEQVEAADLARLVATDPGILREIPQLSDPETYVAAPMEAAAIMRFGELMHEGERAALLRTVWTSVDVRAGDLSEAELRKVVWDVIAVGRRRHTVGSRP